MTRFRSPCYRGPFGEVSQGRLVDAGLRDARSLDDRHAAAKLVLEPGHAAGAQVVGGALGDQRAPRVVVATREQRSEEHTSELQSLMRTSYAVFCLKKKKQ